ncbi:MULTISPECIES: DUF1294 domain-containing protein [Methanoculleus]|jgi:uncharacterized membrane protein YsdA (DUF1294 family)|uniref:Uncharacterized membrane protein YsdA, DUF1294 family n=1 Tax=Methanoculleus thermophilus TaxID=2200 RepID=A0A1G9A7H3_9EURY|nr:MULTISPECIES: DUF1294 domain-containing protein [Methanoculleus]NLN08667.1 DUF1294 domain-containing protein [Methanoculleus thermophilus]SDK23279.1 Uncharacterized membrane protein YsdA, DUF1294 family [Methanoculleus thermophilus]HQD26521.1 DUF1294 domain-containing protein [Methanoculleus thermophilus]
MILLEAAIAIYLTINAAAFLAYYSDKRSARRSAWRTPEKTLLVMALLGPFGALFAMRLFRHKTQKGKFRLVPLFLCLHIVLAVAFVLTLT